MEPNVTVNVQVPAGKGNSYFDGGLLSLLGWKILGGLITVVTFGICYPWALCMVYVWKIKHTFNLMVVQLVYLAIGLNGFSFVLLLLAYTVSGLASPWKNGR